MIKLQEHTKGVSILIVLTSIIPLIACAGMNPEKQMVRESKECANLRGEESSIIIRKSGWIVCDQNGNEVVPTKRAVFPMKATSIEYLEGITVLEAKGSHYFVVCGTRGCKEYNLPH